MSEGIAKTIANSVRDALGIKDIENAFLSVARTIKDITVEISRANNDLKVSTESTLSAISSSAKSAAKIQQDEAQKTSDLLSKIQRMDERGREQHALRINQYNKRILQEEKEAAKERAKLILGFAGATMRGVGGGARTGYNMIRGAYAVSGGMSLADSLKVTNEAELASVHLSRKINRERSASEPQVSSDKILNIAREVENESGVDRSTLLKGWSAFADHGGDVSIFDGKSNDILSSIAEISMATGRSFEQLMTLSSSLFPKGGTGLSHPENPLSFLRQLTVNQTDETDIESIKKVAQSISEISQKTSAMYADSNAQLISLYQQTEPSYQTGESNKDDKYKLIENLFEDFSKNALANEQRGIQTKDHDGRFLPVNQIIGSYFRVGKGSSELMGKNHLGLSEMSIKMLNPFKKIYDDAIQSGHTSDEAASIVTQTLNNSSAIRYGDTQVKEDAQAVRNTDAHQLEESIRFIGHTIGSELVPALRTLAKFVDENKESIKSLINELGQLVKFMAENPKTSLGLLMAGGAVKEVGSMAIGAGLSAAITSGLGTAGGLAGGAAGAVGTAAALASFAPVAAIVGTAITAIVAGAAAGSASADRFGGWSTEDGQLYGMLTGTGVATAIAGGPGGLVLGGAQVLLTELAAFFKQIPYEEVDEDTYLLEKSESSLSKFAKTAEPHQELQRLMMNDLIDADNVKQGITRLFSSAIDDAHEQLVTSPDAPSRNGPMCSRPTGM